MRRETGSRGWESRESRVSRVGRDRFFGRPLNALGVQGKPKRFWAMWRKKWMEWELRRWWPC